MAQNLHTLLRSATAITLAGTVAFAQGLPPAQRTIGTRIDVPPINERINIAPIEEGPGAFSKPRATDRSRIFGVVIDELGFVVPSAGFVIVRSLQNGQVVGQTAVDAGGQFSVAGIEPGLYAAELVDERGAVLTSSPSFTVNRGEIVQLTPVVSKKSIGGLAALIGRGTAGIVHAAVNAGVLAVQTPAPISP